jgi:ABC-2 type transport system ATP-binding protein
MNDPAVQTTGLVKSYRGVRVLDGVDLSVARGSIFALLGPNGAGKTTMIRILSTLVKPDAGSARVAGFDVLSQRAEVRRSISVTGQTVALDDLQTGGENLRMMAQLSGLSSPQARRRAAELLDQFELAEAGNQRVGTYSGGMRRRLDIAAGLVARPAVVFLDEPTTGLDPRSRLRMWDLVRELVRTGTTIFLTTQYLDEADQLAGRVVVINRGRVVADGTVAALKQRYASLRLDLVASDRDGYDSLTRALQGQIVHSDEASLVHGVATDGSAAHVRSVLDAADPSHSAVASFDIHRATLDDVFLALTGQAVTADRAGSDMTEKVYA